MALVTSGLNFIAAAITNYDTPTFFTNANAYLGVGTGTGAVAAGDVQSTFTSGVWKGMETSYPTTTNAVLVFKSSFGASDANQAWAEWGVANAASGGDLLSRKVEDLGTKASGTWVLTATLTLSIGS